MAPRVIIKSQLLLSSEQPTLHKQFTVLPSAAAVTLATLANTQSHAGMHTSTFAGAHVGAPACASTSSLVAR
eukprot:7253360-Alexandrium_andersonii.AAC.1